MIRVNTSELMMTVENDYLQYSTGTRDSGMEKYFIKDGEGRISLNVPIISNYHPLPLKYLLILGYLSIWIIWTYMSPYVLVFLWFNTFFFWRFHFHYLRFLFLLLKAGCWKKSSQTGEFHPFSSSIPRQTFRQPSNQMEMMIRWIFNISNFQHLIPPQFIIWRFPLKNGGTSSYHPFFPLDFPWDKPTS